MKVYPIKFVNEQNAMATCLRKQSPRNYAIWVVGTLTGLRVSDIVSLTVKDVEGPYLRLTEKKTGKHKQIKINAKLRVAINEYIAKLGLKADQPLFASRQNSSLSTRQVQRVIKWAAKVVGVERNVNSHSMRKTFAYNIYVASKYDIALVMKALNHTKQEITMRYLGLDDDRLDDLIEML